jgi:flagellar biosynthesis chaperone FliJ
VSSARAFRLASVLRVAKLREQQRERELAAGLAAERRAEATCVVRLAAYEDRPADREIGLLRARAVLDADRSRDEAHDQLTAARGRWLDATRHRRVLDELEARHHAAAALVATRASQRALDDLARRRRFAS